MTAQPPACSLVLYVAGASERSAEAIEDVHGLCARLPGRFDLRVVDIREHADLAAEDGVLCTPTLIMRGPAHVTGRLPQLVRSVGRLNADKLARTIELSDPGPQRYRA